MWMSNTSERKGQRGFRKIVKGGKQEGLFTDETSISKSDGLFRGGRK